MQEGRASRLARCLTYVDGGQIRQMTTNGFGSGWEKYKPGGARRKQVIKQKRKGVRNISKGGRPTKRLHGAENGLEYEEERKKEDQLKNDAVRER